ncbi:MAG: prepilin-type N-terminal cleavage/methylation domain-containing protein [Planctomycetota bacterium]
MTIRPQATRSDERPDTRRGFSLVELVVVLLLLAILASMAAYSARGVVAKNRLARAVETVEQFDQALRRAARYERREITGVIDRQRGTLSVENGSDEHRFRLPGRVSIESLKMEGSGGGLVAFGDGSTRSYAVELESDRARVFVVFAGGTGQVLHLNDVATVRAILESR